MHRDINPSNILIDQGRYAKLADFGAAVYGMKFGYLLHGPVTGTPPYQSPEVLNKGLQTLAMDWWALGVTMYEMLVGHVSKRSLLLRGFFCLRIWSGCL